MRDSCLGWISCSWILLGSFAISAEALAEERSQWLVQTSVYTNHFHDNPEHNNHQHVVGVEYHRADRWLVGAAAFDNSFGQPSQFVYIGRLWRPFESASLVHVKVTGGLVHGYTGKYRDKIPLNSSGVAPAIVPAIGLSGRHVTGEIVILGVADAGLMITIGVLF